MRAAVAGQEIDIPARVVVDVVGRVELLADLTAGGMAVNIANKAAFIAASKAIYDEYASTVEGGAEMIAKAQSLAD